MWSIGCTLYELYTGKILFAGDSNNQMLKAIMEIRGRLTPKLYKRGQLSAQHFDEAGQFISVERDKVLGKVRFLLVPFCSIPQIPLQPPYHSVHVTMVVSLAMRLGFLFFFFHPTSRGHGQSTDARHQASALPMQGICQRHGLAGLPTHPNPLPVSHSPSGERLLGEPVQVLVPALGTVVPRGAVTRSLHEGPRSARRSGVVTRAAAAALVACFFSRLPPQSFSGSSNTPATRDVYFGLLDVGVTG